MDWEVDAEHDKELREEGPRLLLGQGTLPAARRELEEEHGPAMDWEEDSKYDKSCGRWGCIPRHRDLATLPLARRTLWAAVPSASLPLEW